MLIRRALTATGLLALAALIGCSSKAPAPAPQAALKVTDIAIGKSLAADKTIADKTDAFAAADTIYLSVQTEGASSNASLKARWTYEDGQVVDETAQTIAPTGGAAVTEFHISKPTGWPVGSYKVEVLLDGASAGSKNFKVS